MKPTKGLKEEYQPYQSSSAKKLLEQGYFYAPYVPLQVTPTVAHGKVNETYFDTRDSTVWDIYFVGDFVVLVEPGEKYKDTGKHHISRTDFLAYFIPNSPTDIAKWKAENE